MEVGCIGMCYLEPMMAVCKPGGPTILYGNLTADKTEMILQSYLIEDDPCAKWAVCTLDDARIEDIRLYEDHPMMGPQVRIALRNCGLIDPGNIYHYIARGGYSGLQRALEMYPAEVIKEIKTSRLRGRGGAGFPTGIKWEFARNALERTKYIICNADEGDPGAFMDRALLEGDPHAVLEGMLICAFAIGAVEAYIYVRAEYPLAIERLLKAMADMEQIGLLGNRILGSRFALDIHIKEGAGAFVCGEETALMASIQGRRGMPRSRPPFPAQSGLWDKPTNINNVETFANVSAILQKGADWYAGFGTEKSKGTKTFSLAGKVARTGLIEVPMGMKLEKIIYDIGGGTSEGKKIKGVQTGGPSGGCIPVDRFDLTVDYESLAAAGSIMGSGGMVVMDQDTCMVDMARYFLTFTQAESCGKCLPCRLGTHQMLGILEDICEGKGTLDDIDLLTDLSETVQKGSLCGLGQTAPNPVRTTLRYFRSELEDHLRRKHCDALVCKDLISSPCQYTCPINQDVPCYMGYIAQGRFDDAIRVIREENPLPGVCGRVCPNPCEGKCDTGKHGDPIAIRALKRFASDYEMQKGIKPPIAEIKYDEKIAIIGSGPAGLTAAWYLQNAGYQCTIFEALKKAGGMLRVGIPDYRLPENVLDYEIDYIKSSGVEIKMGQKLGKDFSIDDLFKKGYRAVFLAIGSHKPFELGIEGADHHAVLPGVKFLSDVNMKNKVVLGRRVAVIGGGNVAIDSARTSIRLGAEQAFILYRRSHREMPALKEELVQLEEEGIEIRFLVAPAKVVQGGNGIKGVECLKMELGEPDGSGRRRPVPVGGTEFLVECDNVIVAIGQTSDLEFLGGGAVKATKRGAIKVDGETDLCGRDGVFAGGDVVTGPLNVVNAIFHGKLVAKGIQQYLRNGKVEREYKPVKPVEHVNAVELTDEEIAKLTRPEIPRKPVRERIKSFMEVEELLSEEAAVLEAKRCLRCDL
jgi:NADH-quinone oxidoreductase subunit F